MELPSGTSILLLRLVSVIQVTMMMDLIKNANLVIILVRLVHQPLPALLVHLIDNRMEHIANVSASTIKIV